MYPNYVSLVNEMIHSGVLHSPRIIQAFRAVDRAGFVPSDLHDLAYLDRPLPIGDEQTISQPSTVAFMLELLDPRPGDRILDIGSGSGWTTALLCAAVGPEGEVLGLERVPKLLERGQKNLSQWGAPPRCRIETAGRALGHPGERFDRILVSASAASAPTELLDQLRPGGVLVVPVGHTIRRYRLNPDGTVRSESWPGFVFVPLVTND